jgi:hypothetical protein
MHPMTAPKIAEETEYPLYVLEMLRATFGQSRTKSPTIEAPATAVVAVPKYTREA